MRAAPFRSVLDVKTLTSATCRAPLRSYVPGRLYSLRLTCIVRLLVTHLEAHGRYYSASIMGQYHFFIALTAAPGVQTTEYVPVLAVSNLEMIFWYVVLPSTRIIKTLSILDLCPVLSHQVHIAAEKYETSKILISNNSYSYVHIGRSTRYSPVFAVSY